VVLQSQCCIVYVVNPYGSIGAPMIPCKMGLDFYRRVLRANCAGASQFNQPNASKEYTHRCFRHGHTISIKVHGRRSPGQEITLKKETRVALQQSRGRAAILGPGFSHASRKPGHARCTHTLPMGNIRKLHTYCLYVFIPFLLKKGQRQDVVVGPRVRLFPGRDFPYSPWRQHDFCLFLHLTT
jgi:hypothetical protein